MGIKSTIDLSGTVVDGVTLGEPNTEKTPGVFEWDGGVPNGTFQTDGKFLPITSEDEVPTPIDMELVYDVKYKSPEFTDEGVLNQTFKKGQMIEYEGVLYQCNKDGLAVLPPHKDWLVVKTKEVK